jgi:hypothetical protein
MMKNREHGIVAASRLWSAGLVIAISLASMNIGCARIIAGRAAWIMADAVPLMEREEDPVIAEATTLSNLSLLETMLNMSPRNQRLLMMVTKAYAGYGAAFVEPDWSLRDDYFSDDYAAVQRRLIGLYRRSRDTGLRWIEVRRPEVAALLRAGRKDEWIEALPAGLAELDERDLPALYWTAQAWGLLIRVDQENLMELANMTKVEMLMRRVSELDPDYALGSVHLFFAMMDTAMGKEFGDLEAAKGHFEASIAATDGCFLTPRFFYARDYCRAIQDRACFESGLAEIAEEDPEIFPEQRLANTLASRWARQWLEKADEFF